MFLLFSKFSVIASMSIWNDRFNLMFFPDFRNLLLYNFPLFWIKVDGQAQMIFYYKVKIHHYQQEKFQLKNRHGSPLQWYFFVEIFYFFKKIIANYLYFFRRQVLYLGHLFTVLLQINLDERFVFFSTRKKKEFSLKSSY